METFLGRFDLWCSPDSSVVFIGHLCEDNDPLDVLVLMQVMLYLTTFLEYLLNVDCDHHFKNKRRLKKRFERPYCRYWVKKRSKIIVEGLGVMEAYGKKKVKP
ncbi:unnamed protein product [Arabidopsis halleri]